MLIVPRDEPNISSSNVLVEEAGITVYDPDDTQATYNTDQKIQYNGYIYKALKDGLVQIDPETNPLSWKNEGRTNYYRMFDVSMNSATTNPDTIVYEFIVEDVDTLALFGLTAKTVKIELINDLGEVIYEEEKETYNRRTPDWYEWTYARPTYNRSVVFQNIMMSFNATLKVTIDNTGTDAAVSHLTYGRSMDIGWTLISPEPVSSIRNLISKEKDSTTGVVTTENSMTYKRVVANVLIDNISLDEIQEFMEDYTVTPCLYIGDERDGGYRALMVYGLYRDFDMPIGRTKTVYQLEIDGVI